LLSETGHLVLTTIHARSAEQALNKLIWSFTSEEQNHIRTQIAENMSAIIVQKLMRRIDKPGLSLAQEVLLNTTAVSNIIR
jgi:twitching motility protein PilT